ISFLILCAGRERTRIFLYLAALLTTAVAPHSGGDGVLNHRERSCNVISSNVNNILLSGYQI
ncbi:hypothetical protein AB0132_05700, partial [Klebsiella quasipneumoniae]|uniref:hypothetical protein n=1 Tax=Klebsiella quasipneumoniae TaxID=1463165 RepID=UPI00344D32A1